MRSSPLSRAPHQPALSASATASLNCDTTWYSPSREDSSPATTRARWRNASRPWNRNLSLSESESNPAIRSSSGAQPEPRAHRATISTRLHVFRIMNSRTPFTHITSCAAFARSSGGRWNGALRRDGSTASDVPTTTSSSSTHWSARIDAISFLRSRALLQERPFVDTATETPSA